MYRTQQITRDESAAHAAQMLDRLKAQVGCRHASIVFLHPEEDVIEDAFGTDLLDEIWEAFGPGPDGTSPLFATIESGNAMRVDDTTADARISNQRKRLCADLEVNSFWLVPLRPFRAAILLTDLSEASRTDPVAVLPHAIEVANLIVYARHRELSSLEASAYDPTSAYWRNVMLDAVPDPVILSDDENNIIEMNKQARDLLQVEPDATEGRLMAVELNNFLLSAALSSFALDQGAALARDFTLVDPVEGTDLLFEVISGWHDNVETDERRLVSVLRNVTDLSEATTQLNEHLRQLHESNLTLQRERDRLNLLLENLRDPVIVADPSGEILRMNPAGERLLSSPAGNPEARGIRFSNETRLTAFLLDLEIAPESTRTGELLFKEPATGEDLSMGAAATKVRDRMNQVVALVCVLHDLTEVKELERRRLEQRIFESEKLAALGRLAAAVAHEINNPLEAVKNAVYLVNEAGVQDDRKEFYFGIVTRETERISRIIRQMLGLYRPQTVHDLIDVGMIVNDAVGLIRRNLAAKHAQVVVMEPAEPIPPVRASADQVTQVLLNLLLNAADATGDHGVIRISTRLVTRGTNGVPGPFVGILVEDNGSGIAAEDLTHLFDPFFTTKREGMGTGLGLWISRDIVHHHGGDIQVESEKGKGTTFTVYLPVGDES